MTRRLIKIYTIIVFLSTPNFAHFYGSPIMCFSSFPQEARNSMHEVLVHLVRIVVRAMIAMPHCVLHHHFLPHFPYDYSLLG